MTTLPRLRQLCTGREFLAGNTVPLTAKSPPLVYRTLILVPVLLERFSGLKSSRLDDYCNSEVFSWPFSHASPLERNIWISERNTIHYRERPNQEHGTTGRH